MSRKGAGEVPLSGLDDDSWVVFHTLRRMELDAQDLRLACNPGSVLAAELQGVEIMARFALRALNAEREAAGKGPFVVGKKYVLKKVSA